MPLDDSTPPPSPTRNDNEFDVIIIGAGISGISAAYHLQRDCADRSYTIFEARDALGGTWDLFRYPGVRSDSDMHTLGFGFRPWSSTTSIAEGDEILQYLRDTAHETGIAAHIRYNHRLVAADWDSTTARWILQVDQGGHRSVFRCNFLMVCAGYYSYRRGHSPAFSGQETFTGPIVHPQQWPDDLDVAGRRIVVIGSGATAITLVPALADLGAQVTMLQRSPTYVVSRPRHDRLSGRLTRLLGATLAQRVTRSKNIALQRFTYRTSQRKPDKVRSMLLEGVRNALDPSIDVETHFTPDYDPWTQRLCLIPDGDLFRVLNSRQAEVVTGEIDTFTESGIALVDNTHVDADIIVTATGLELVTLAEADFSIDGEPIDFSETWTYRGLAYSGVPNLVSTFGYIAASWTLRADLVSQYACRLLNHLRDTGTEIATPTLRPEDHDMARRPWIDRFSPGYLERMMPRLPAQGDREPWTNPQDYRFERRVLSKGEIDDGVIVFERVTSHR